MNYFNATLLEKHLMKTEEMSDEKIFNSFSKDLKKTLAFEDAIEARNIIIRQITNEFPIKRMRKG